MGPSGIMSLDSFGDVGGGGAGGADTDAGGGARDNARFSGKGPGESDRQFDRRVANERAALQIAERKQARDLSRLTGRDIKERRNIALASFGPLQKYTGRSRFFGGANRFGYTDTLPDGSLRPGFGGRVFGGLLSLLTGIPFIGGAIGSMYDKGTGIFDQAKGFFRSGPNYNDMSEFNRLGLFGVPPGTLDEDDKISDTSFTLNDPNAIITTEANPNELSGDFMSLEEGVEPGFSPLQARDGGRIQYMNGGLTDIVDIYD